MGDFGGVRSPAPPVKELRSIKGKMGTAMETRVYIEVCRYNYRYFGPRFIG